jgi:hypothetical protein
MSNADPLLDLFAVAEGAYPPDVRALLKQVASKRLRGTRIVMVTTRAVGSPQRLELEQIVSQQAAHESAGPLEIFEADYDRLASIFEFV